MEEFLRDLLSFPILSEFLQAGLVAMLIVIGRCEYLTSWDVEGIC